ncbi:uncharacterized protein LOC124157939 isoform X2 [Ischnura elegans]|nr:uncharacterized protein LOC124157939 isoform X2 [Ischnura elegans]
MKKMIEETGDSENISKDIQERGESDVSQLPVGVINANENVNTGQGSSSCLSASKMSQPDSCSQFSMFSCSTVSPPQEEVPEILPSSQTTGIPSASKPTHPGVCPSPLLFTPVKGEDIHGAGILSRRENAQVTPNTSEKVASASKNLPPRFCTPSPKLNKRPTIELNGSGTHFSASKKRSNEQFSTDSPARDCDSPIANSTGPAFSIGKKRSNEQCSSDSPVRDCDTPKESPEFKVKYSRSECMTCLNGPCKSPSHTHHNIQEKKLDVIVSPSPSKCSGSELKATAAQIDSSPSASECSDTSLFVTPIKGDEINVVTQELRLPHRNNQIRSKRKHRLRTLVTRARHSLAGVPPPPSFTIPQITVDEMLLKLRDKSHSAGFVLEPYDVFSPSGVSNHALPTSSPSHSNKDAIQPNLLVDNAEKTVVDGKENTMDGVESRCSPTRTLNKDTCQQSVPSVQPAQQKLRSGKKLESFSLFHPSATEKEIISLPWPAVLDCIHPGVCYNLGTSSEALEELCQQVREKFVGNETASSCTIWSVSNVSRRSSPRQRKSSNSQANPQVKEGYIMRRRRAFSVASLSSSIPSMTTKSRQILIDRITKLTDSKKPKKVKEDKIKLMAKEAPKISLLKKFNEDLEGNSNKMKRSYSFSGSSCSGAQLSNSTMPESPFLSQSSSKLMSTKRVLKFDRLPRASSSPSLDGCFSQSKLGVSALSSQNSGDDVNSVKRSTPDCVKNLSSHPVGSSGNKDLSEVYKKKLLWAVAEALRSRGLGTGHEKFKSCAIPLFRSCRDAFIALPNASSSKSSDETSSQRASEPKLNVSIDGQKERTSDKMLSIAMQLVDQVMNEVGVEPVIKD